MVSGIVNGQQGHHDLRRDLIAGHAEGAAYGGMVGLGETYLPAFVLAVGLGEITAGLVASVPLLAGGLMQMISPAAIGRLASHKAWVLVCALAQALSFVPLVVAALWGGISAPAVLLVATLYWGAGLATGPAWNTWMGALVPRPLRARFFAERTRLSQLAVLAGFLVGGAALQWVGSRDAVLLAFAGLFLAAGLCRVVSFALLALQAEPVPLASGMRRIPLGRAWGQIRRAGSGPLLAYLVVVQGVVQVSGPYFTPYMFEKLDLSYARYVVLLSAAFVAKIVLLPVWGRMAHRVGAIRLLWLGGVGIVPTAGLWIVSDGFAWLFFIQVLAGAVWAAYELGFFLMFFESIPEDDRTGVLTFYNLANTAAWVLGSAAGGLLLYSLGTARIGYLLLFGISSAGRAAALLLLWRVPATVVPAAAVGVRTVGVRPMTASIDAPILPALPDQAPPPVEDHAQAP